MNGNINLPSAKTMISTAASVAATAMVVRSFAKDIVPPELTQYLFSKFHQFLSAFNKEMTVIIDDYEGLNRNSLFYAAEIYLSTIISPNIKSLRASLPEKEKTITVSAGGNEELVDNFGGLQVRWSILTKQTKGSRYVHLPDGYSSSISEVKYMVLRFHKKHKNKVIDDYLPYVLERSNAVAQEKKTLKLHTLGDQRMMSSYTRNNPWQAVNLDHPAKFETLAMDDEIKNMIIDDLDRFVERKDFYRKVGKAWKRGYLLFGPPGTGKSSLIAAMANKLNFDVYDLELTDIRCNSDLRRLLITTGNRSILVVEDIDASIDLSERGKTAAQMPARDPFSLHNEAPKVTLSGLLNFVDGLWSSCGDERIIVFTTNHIEKLDPALLRPGRMDVHIHMSYCTPCGFKMLLKNYLETYDNPLAMEAERLLASTKVTPAEVAEQLLKSDNPEATLRGLIEFLERKKESGRKLENSEVTKQEVPKMENEENKETKSLQGPENERTEEIKIVASPEIGIQELVKMAKASPAELRKRIVNKDEIPESDLRFLIEFLQGEVGNQNGKDFEALALPQQEKQEEINTE